jgi:hypothetical protein
MDELKVLSPGFLSNIASLGAGLDWTAAIIADYLLFGNAKTKGFASRKENKISAVRKTNG